jgi:ribosome biogenesis GTPase / thiamine phosphate phosphatase
VPTLTETDLASLGWDAFFAAALAAYGDPGLRPGRVVRVDRGRCQLLSESGAETVTLSGALLAAAAADPSELPCTGDWLAVRPWPDGRVTAEAVLPRRTALVRAVSSPGVAQGQVLAANADAVAVVEGLQPEPDIGRIERLLVLLWESRATPVVVLTKADLAGDGDAVREEVAAAAPGVDVHLVSAVTGLGLDAMAPLVAPGRTLALVGRSGSGKSTLTNALAGAQIMATRDIRGDGKGRHTTVHRELVQLAGGGMVIDTPGLRGIGLWDAGDSVERVFADVEQLAAGCRFADCTHDGEPGCAVTAARDAGVLSERRWASYRKLQREAAWIAARQDARLRAERAKAWRRISVEMRRSGRSRP